MDVPGLLIQLLNLPVNIARLVAELMKEKRSPKSQQGKGTPRHFKHLKH
jgi:hypothetical protein